MGDNLRSVDMHRTYRDAQDRFDNFVLGALLAAAGYLAQSNPYARLGWNPETAFFGALLALVAAIFFAFKRVEYVIVGYRVNSQLLHYHEQGKQGGVDAARAGLDSTVRPKAENAYKWRNRAMVVGLALYVAAKLWQAYRVT